MRNTLIALFPLLISCATLQKTQVPVDSSLFQQAEESQIKFETTNSPCIDAMIINMLSTGCKNIAMTMGNMGDMHYSCDDAMVETSSWNDTTFFVISHEDYHRAGFDIQNE